MEKKCKGSCKRCKCDKTKVEAPSYCIRYVDDSNPKTKKFKSLTALNEFVHALKKDPPNGYWVDYIYYGIELYSQAKNGDLQ